MKYSGYLIVIVLALLTLSFAPTENRRKPTLPPKNCRGHIEWIHSVPYKAIMDSSGAVVKDSVPNDSGEYDAMTGSEQPIQTWTYDEYGDQLENDKYHANGSIYSKIIHEYYPNGDIKEVIDSSDHSKINRITVRFQKYNYKYDGSGNLLDSTVCSYYNSTLDYCIKKVRIYNESGKLLEELHFDNDTINPASLILYIYNEKGQLVEADHSKRGSGYRGDLVPTEKNILWYDNEGRIIDKATYRFHEGLVKDVKTEFGSTGYRIKTFSYGTHRMLTSAVIKSFFEATNTLQQDTYDADGLLTEYTISHLDSDQHIMDEGVFHITYHNTSPGDTVMVHHIINDDHYNVVEDDNFSGDGKTISHESYQYTYDSIGNWIEKTEFDNNKPVKIVERGIGYYKD